MLIAYTNALDPKATTLQLCIMPEKLDPFAQPLRVAALRTTDNAVIRVSALEGIKVRRDATDEGLVIEGIKPARIFLTPSQPDLPGIEIRFAKFIPLGEGQFRIFFQTLFGKADWREWIPNQEQ